MCGRTLDAVSVPALAHRGDKILFANAAMVRLLGFPRETLLGMDFDAWVVPSARPAMRAHSLQCLVRGDEMPTLEVEAFTANQSSRALELGVRRMDDRGGALVVMTAQDQSDIRFVQQSLLDMSLVMRQVVENDPVATFVIDAGHRVTQWNAACAQLTGIPPHQMIGRTDVWRAFYPEARPMMADLVVDGRIAEDGPALYGPQLRPSPLLPRTFEMEEYFPSCGGQERWLYFNSAPLLDAEGRVIGAIETLQDVSARRNAEEQLRRHQQELEVIVAERTAELLITHHDLDAFLDNAPVGIMATEDGYVVRCNKTFANMFDLEEGSVWGMRAASLFQNPGDHDVSFGTDAFDPRAGASLAREFPMCTSRGSALWVQVIAYSAEPGKPRSRIWWLLQDRSNVLRAQRELVENFRHLKAVNAKLEQAQNQLLQSEKMASIGQLAAGVAHEINNPIGFVSSNLHTLRSYGERLLGLVQAYAARETPEQAQDPELAALKRAAELDYLAEDLPVLLRESEDGLTRVKKIVQNLKDFSRVDTADWQDADLNAGLESTLHVVMNEVKYKADVVRRYGQLPPVRCLAAQLNQVFMNLIVNAAHAIPGRGIITLSTGAEGDQAWVEVADNGAGMPPEVLNRIFEPFFTTKPVGKGTGLGLSLSFSIVQKHGGRIEVDSQVGAGTRFRVWVPVAGQAAAPG
ncbi:MAG: PAS domain-containing protein [Rubrivivax sp.]|nr:PAS domain-containing protein [Rubrivivax sp.]